MLRGICKTLQEHPKKEGEDMLSSSRKDSEVDRSLYSARIVAFFASSKGAFPLGHAGIVCKLGFPKIIRT